MNFKDLLIYNTKFSFESLCEFYSPTMLVLKFIGYYQLNNLIQCIGKLFCYRSNVCFFDDS